MLIAPRLFPHLPSSRELSARFCLAASPFFPPWQVRGVANSVAVQGPLFSRWDVFVRRLASETSTAARRSLSFRPADVPGPEFAPRFPFSGRQLIVACVSCWIFAVLGFLLITPTSAGDLRAASVLCPSGLCCAFLRFSEASSFFDFGLQLSFGALFQCSFFGAVAPS